MALDLTDKTSNNNNLTNQGATEWTTDFPFVTSTEAVALASASSQYLTAADSDSLDLSTALTLELWVKFDSFPGVGSVVHLFFKKDNGGNGYRMRFDGDGTTDNFTFIISNATSDDVFTKNFGALSTNTWYHIAVNWLGSSKTAEFFLNGVSKGTATGTNFASIGASTSLFYIGSSNTPNQFWDGKFDDIRVWNIVRTETEINNNKSLELTGDESGLVAYWPFEILDKISDSYSIFM